MVQPLWMACLAAFAGLSVMCMTSSRETCEDPHGPVDAVSLLAARGRLWKRNAKLGDEHRVGHDHDLHVRVQQPQEKSPQTTYDCIGEDAGHRHCIFKNLYFGTLPGYSTPDFFMMVPQDQHQGDVSFLRADKYDYPWRPHMHTLPTAKDIQDYVDSKVLLEEPDLSVQFNPLFHHNIGHAIFDGLYPAYVALAALGQQERKFRPVVSVDAGCFDEHNQGPLQPGQIVETYLPDPKYGRSLRTSYVTLKSLPASFLEGKKRTCNFQEGLDSRGEDLGVRAASDESSCCQACGETFGCESAVLFAGTCYLKGKCSIGGSCSVASAERKLCMLQGTSTEGNLTVLVSNNEVSVPTSWVQGKVRRRCMSEGVFETFGRSGEIRRLFEMRRDVGLNSDLLLRFEEIVMGVGGAGNMVSDRSGAIGGSQPPMDAMRHFRDRMYASYGISVNSEMPKTGDKLNVMVVSNKRFNDGDFIEIEGSLKDAEQQGPTFAETVDWQTVGAPDTRFRDQLKRVSEADVYVSSIGTALQYVPFMRDGRVYVALGSIWQKQKRLVPTFMEQQLAGAGTPYLRTLYADPGAVLRNSSKPQTEGAMLMDLGEDGYRVNVNRTLLADLLGDARTLIHGGFKIPVPPEDNLSEEGRLIVELIQQDPTTGQQMQDDRNTGGCAALLWNELIVYEVGPWAEGGPCTVNRKLLRQLRKKHGLFSYGAPEV